MRFVDVVFEFLFDLRQHLDVGIRVPERVACLGDNPGQPLDGLHGRGSPLHRFLTAHGFQPQNAATLHQHAHPIAADDPAGLVGQHKRRGHGIERLVHGPAEPLHLRERSLLNIILDELLPLGHHLLVVSLPVEVDGSEAGHLLRKPQVAPLNVVLVWLVEEFDQARSARRAVDRGRDHQQRRAIRRQGRPIGPVHRLTRSHQHAGTAAKEARDERVVGLGIFRRGRYAGQIDAGMADRLHLPAIADQPNHLGDRLHQPVHTVANEPEELSRRHIAVGHLLELGEKLVNFPPRPLELLGFVVAAHGCDIPPALRCDRHGGGG